MRFAFEVRIIKINHSVSGVQLGLSSSSAVQVHKCINNELTWVQSQSTRGFEA